MSVSITLYLVADTGKGKRYFEVYSIGLTNCCLIFLKQYCQFSVEKNKEFNAGEFGTSLNQVIDFITKDLKRAVKFYDTIEIRNKDKDVGFILMQLVSLLSECEENPNGIVIMSD